ncbi:SDR family NAD(P)-dependent oxidoreductase [Rhodococcus sp. NPDC003322]
MSKTLDGQVALITGGGRGLGRSIALALAEQGASVAIDDVYVDDAGVRAADVTAKDIEALGSAALALAEDVTTSEGSQAMVDATIERFGRLDILVTCAGNAVYGKLQDLAVEQWDSLMNLHLRGHFLSCKAALPHMLEQNYGRIVTVSSRAAFFQVPASKKESPASKPASTAYAAAKAGILGLTTTLAIETWDTGITVNSLLPSAATQLFPGLKPRRLGGVPAAESMEPDDVAPIVAYLSTPEAADISGKIVYAAGGDVIFYSNPLDVTGSRMVRKAGRWTVDELAQVAPAMAGVVEE